MSEMGLLCPKQCFTRSVHTIIVMRVMTTIFLATNRQRTSLFRKPMLSGGTTQASTVHNNDVTTIACHNVQSEWMSVS